MTGNRCDLHVHSVYSDGTLTPEALLQLAQQRGVRAIALCDHNTADGLPEFTEKAKHYAVEAVAGTEFSTDYGGAELHMLALFIRPAFYEAVSTKAAEMMRRKDACNAVLVARLKEHGFLLDYDTIKAGTPNGLVNRAVIAAEMVRHGYVPSVQAAFREWLSEKRGLYDPPQRLDVFDVIRFIKSIGAVAVLAHPFLNLDEVGLRAFLAQAVPAGLDAMEVSYPRFDAEQTALAAKIAEEFGILPSGGSDFHGANKPDIQIGSGTGTLCVGMEILEALRARAVV